MNTPENHTDNANAQLPDEVLKCLADYGKLLLGPFLKALMEDYEEGDFAQQPSPNWIGVGIYENYYHHGELSAYMQKEVSNNAKSFLSQVIPYKKTAIAAYLYQQDYYRHFLEEELDTDWRELRNDLEDSYEEFEWQQIEIQKRTQQAIASCDIDDMAHWLTKEAKVVEDILGDTDSWDASSAANTNEYFESYLGYSADYFKVFKVNHSDYHFFSYLMDDECELRSNLERAFESMPEYKDDLEGLQWDIEEHIGVKKLKRL